MDRKFGRETEDRKQKEKEKTEQKTKKRWEKQKDGGRNLINAIGSLRDNLLSLRRTV